METKIESTNTIRTRQDFAKFLDALLADYKINIATWENRDLDSFLRALSRYAIDVDGFYKNTNQNVNADDASWKVFADMLMGARVYE